MDRPFRPSPLNLVAGWLQRDDLPMPVHFYRHGPFIITTERHQDPIALRPGQSPSDTLHATAADVNHQYADDVMPTQVSHGYPNPATAQVRHECPPPMATEAQQAHIFLTPDHPHSAIPHVADPEVDDQHVDATAAQVDHGYPDHTTAQAQDEHSYPMTPPVHQKLTCLMPGQPSQFPASFDPKDYETVKAHLIQENTTLVPHESQADVPRTVAERMYYTERLFDAIVATPQFPTARGFDAWLAQRRDIELEVMVAELVDFAIKAHQGIAGVTAWERDINLSKRENFNSFMERFNALEHLVRYDKSVILSYVKANFGWRLVLAPEAEGKLKANNVKNNKRKATQLGQVTARKRQATGKISTASSGSGILLASASGVADFSTANTSLEVSQCQQFAIPEN